MATIEDKSNPNAGGICDGAGANFLKFFCIAFIGLLILGIGINAIVLLIAFKTPTAPEFVVKTSTVAKFEVFDPSTGQPSLVRVISTDITFAIDAINKNLLLGLQFDNMLLDTSWNEVDAHMGESRIDNFVQRNKGVSTLNVATRGEVEVPLASVKVEDMSLDLHLSGQLRYFAGPFKSKPKAFMVFCDDILVTRNNSRCRTEIFSDGELPPPVEGKIEKGGEEAGSPPPSAEEAQPPSSLDAFPPVKLFLTEDSVIMDNGILAATIAKPAGYVTGIKYNGMDNILDEQNPEDDRGYWNIVWNPGDTDAKGKEESKGSFVRIGGTDFRVIEYKPKLIELSFKFSYDHTKTKLDDQLLNPPMDIDVRYIMLRGVAGIYSYAIFERAHYPPLNLGNARLAFKLQRQKFTYMVISDDRQREMPVPEDRIPPKSEQLAFPEAMKLIDPQNSDLKGEVDDKYQYSMESQNIRVHGWICKDPPTGFWQITPSYEFRTGGPNKQFLTSHVGPSTLAMFVSSHYSGDDLVPRFGDREPWNHVYGPIFMYMNNASKDDDFHLLWDDAKQRMLMEVKSWPYRFPSSQDFAKTYQRVNVTGRFFVFDKFVANDKVPSKGAFIGLAPPGESGSWQKECKQYQFWTETDEQGFFNITFVRVGIYDVFGFVNGTIGDFKLDRPSLNITIGKNIDLGEIVYKPPRDGPTLWEIGIPDRTSKEFYVPDPNPNYVNNLYVNHTDRFRQYGLWERYTEIYLDNDLVYDVKLNDYKKDWFFAQVTKKIGERYNGTTWQVQFNLENVVPNGVYKLRLAIASSTNSFLEVRFNEPKPSPPIFDTGAFGDCNAIARHGIHGLYWLYNIDVPGRHLRMGNNTLFLTQTKGSGPFQGIMYDYIRLEGPSTI